MNHLRSTERTLTLLKLGSTRRCTSRSYQRSIQGNSIENVSNLQKIYKRAAHAAILRGPKIKLIDLSKPKNLHLRYLSTAESPTPNFSLLNPNKLEPNNDKILQPIERPLTLPKFPSNHSTKDTPSVTKILQTTMPAASAYILDKWREAMIKKLGAQGFSQYQKDTFERGRVLHALVANYLLGSGAPVDGQGDMSKEVVSNLWKSIEKVVKEKITNVRLIEHIVSYKEMNYRGIVDCVAYFENQLVVIDFKTSEKPKKTMESLYDNPLQVSAYCGAINNDTSIPLHVIDRNICAGVVIVAYIDGSEASTYHIGQEQMTDAYWKQWTVRVDQYNRLDELRKKQQSKQKS